MSDPRYAPANTAVASEAPSASGYAVAPPITFRRRAFGLLAAIAVSIYQGAHVWPIVAIPWESPQWAFIGVAISAAGWLIVFCPAWLPLLVPPSFPRVSRGAFAVGGLLLVAMGALLGLYGIALAFNLQRLSYFAAYGAIGVAVGAYYLVLAVSRK